MPTSRVAIIVWVAAALGVASPVIAQELVIVPKLRVGDEFHLQVTRTRQNSARPEQNGKSTTDVSVTVVAASAEGTTIDWVPGETTFSDGRTAQDPVIQLASKAMEGFRLRISLDKEGAFAGLANERKSRRNCRPCSTSSSARPSNKSPKPIARSLKGSSPRC